MSGLEMVVPTVGIILVLGVAYLFFMLLKRQIDIRMKKEDIKKE
jgi:heme O synthase-like polyprenyltransferase